MENLQLVFPEIFLSLSIMFLLILGVFKKNSSKLIQNMFKNLCDSGFENDDHCSLYKEISNLK